MTNRIEVMSMEGDKYFIDGSHKRHIPISVDSESKIFEHLPKFAKYFFPESMEINYSRADLSEQTKAGIKAFEEIYNIGASEYTEFQKFLLRINDTLNKKIKSVRGKD